ncbi:GDP-mannose 4,6-dehydratase [Paenibacillus sp. GCM10012303]|uniref:GDP-mannose 4,6-dehydratase n=1 Tax=Paenibacillus sp. GCM10012303 TaxID=3317340 RepID=UPI00361E0393
MKALVTGATGFVGEYLCRYLVSIGYEVWGTSRRSSPVMADEWKIVTLNLNDQGAILSLLNDIKPDEIYHLAGQSSVKYSWNNKIETMDSNFGVTMNLLEALVSSTISTQSKLLVVGSSEEYGKVCTDSMPISETTPLNPISPYGVSKASVHLLSKHYINSYGLDIVHARPFNHIGPGQGSGFVATDFAKQVAEIELGNRVNPEIIVGNLTAKRDFLDVRDIVKAYQMLMVRGKSGEVYNICSSKPVEICYLLNYFVSQSNKKINVTVDENLLRPVDFPVYFGNNSRLIADTGWRRTIPLEISLNDIYHFMLDIVRRNKLL